MAMASHRAHRGEEVIAAEIAESSKLNFWLQARLFIEMLMTLSVFRGLG